MSEKFLLENDRISVFLDEYGRIISLKDKSAELDFFEQKSRFMGKLMAGLRVRDELKFKDFCELWENPEEVNVEKGENILIFRKTFMEADFRITEKFTLKKDHLYWHVKLIKTRGRDRTVQIRFMLPFFEFWHFWAPCDGTPFPLDGMKSFRFTYPFGSRVNQDGRIAIPIATVYNSELNVGLSFIEPFEIPKPGVSFVYESSETDIHYGIRPTVYYEEPKRMPYIQVINLYLRLTDDDRTQAALMLVPHEGDWRPGLGWLYNRYKEYFTPPLKEAHEHVGIHMSGFLPNEETEEMIKRVSKYGRILWEIHGFFPHYGLFVPDEEPWEARAHSPGTMVKYDDIRKLIKMLHKYGAHAYIYWEMREGLKNWSLENFPDSLVKTEKGELVPAYRGNLSSEQGGCYLLNPDLRYSWGKHCLRQAERELETYPEVDGIFVDGYREMEIDFAHDDGITMVHNKPCYNWNFAYHPIMEKVSEMCHSMGKGLYGNKPVTVETQKYLDILMIESSNVSYFINIAYMGLNKPLSWISMFERGRYDLSREETCREYLRDLEHKLKLCLKWGAFPQRCILQLTKEEVWEEGVKIEDYLYSRYMRLIEMLRGRKWIFEPNPISFSHGLDGNIFEAPNGDILIPLIVTSSGSIFEGGELKGGYVKIRLPRLTIDQLAELYLLEQDKPLTLPIEAAEKPWTGIIRIPHIRGAAIVKILRKS